MSSRHVPVHMGSPRFRTEVTRTALTTQAWFAPECTLYPHTHERAIFAVMLDGSFETAVTGRRLACVPGAVWTEPAEERHANYIGAMGARVLVIQPDPARDEVFEPFLTFLGEVNLFRHAGVATDARRIAGEMAVADSLSPLAIDALIVGMLTTATRLGFADPHHGRCPVWLSHVQEFLHDNVAGDLSLATLAAVGGVHASHLAHAFRRYFGMTVGAYARRLRLETALDRLARTEVPISEVAVAAGFADQSHLTRACRAVLGITPREYRRRFRAL